MAHGKVAAGRTVRTDAVHAGRHYPGKLFAASALVDAHGGKCFVVRRSTEGGRFALVRAQEHEEGWQPEDDWPGVIYQPIAPGVTAADVEAATFAWDDDGAWRFAHGSPGQHYDWEAAAEGLLVTSFQSLVNAALLAGVAGFSVNTKSRGLARASALLTFVEEARSQLRTVVRAATLGFWWRAPADHLRVAVAEAIATTWKGWQTVPSTVPAEEAIKLRQRAGLITGDVSSVLSGLRHRHPIETRGEQLARIAAEAARKAAAGSGAGAEEAGS